MSSQEEEVADDHPRYVMVQLLLKAVPSTMCTICTIIITKEILSMYYEEMKVWNQPFLVLIARGPLQFRLWVYEVYNRDICRVRSE